MTGSSDTPTTSTLSRSWIAFPSGRRRPASNKRCCLGDEDKQSEGGRRQDVMIRHWTGQQARRDGQGHQSLDHPRMAQRFSFWLNPDIDGALRWEKAGENKRTEYVVSAVLSNHPSVRYQHDISFALHSSLHGGEEI